ncbi:MAG: hypothetical protein FWF29_05175 [Treponema sp.]|nr:hypothetical protein [Treponema sp.]
MKKTSLVFALLSVLCFSVYASDLFKVTLDAVTDTLYMRNFYGDYSRRTPEISGSPYRYQGDGDIKSFQSSMFDDGIKGRFGLSFANQFIGASMQLRMVNDSSFLKDWDWNSWVTFKPLFNALTVRLTAGNTGQNGEIPQYSNFDSFLKTNIGSFGILFPIWKINEKFVHGNNFDTISNFPYGYEAMGDDYGYSMLFGTDIYDLFMPAGAFTRNTLNFMADLKFDALTVSLATGGLFEKLSIPSVSPWMIGQAMKGENPEAMRINYYDVFFDPVTKGGVNFAVRAEGLRIMDLVSLAAVYKYRATHITKDIPHDTSGVSIDEHTANHAYGLYANVSPFTGGPLDGLGVSLGYSGLFFSWYNTNDFTSIDVNKTEGLDHDLSNHREVRFPLYHGIDLRFCYTGLENVTITFNNNLSMAKINGMSKNERDKQLWSEGWAYGSFLNNPVNGVWPENRSESYFGIFNALGFRYQFSGGLIAEISAASQIGIFTLIWENDSVQSVTNYLGFYLGASCPVFSMDSLRGSLRGGFSLRMANYSSQLISTGTPVAKAGFYDIGIPLSLKVEF